MVSELAGVISPSLPPSLPPLLKILVVSCGGRRADFEGATMTMMTEYQERESKAGGSWPHPSIHPSSDMKREKSIGRSVDASIH